MTLPPARANSTMGSLQPGHGLRRRSLVQGLAAAALAPALPTVQAGPASRVGERHLLVFSLFGGNDGLNTVVPYRDPLYRRLRPTLALPARSLLPLNDDLALHPALTTLHALYEAGEVAVVMDVGSPQPTLSHFEAGATWDCADLAGTHSRTGWFAQLVQDNTAAVQAVPLDLTAISFAPGDRFALGEGVSQLTLHNLRQFLATVPDLAPPSQTPAGSAMARYLRTLEQDAQVARQRLASRLQGRALPAWAPYEEPLTVQVKTAGWLLAQGVQVPAMKLLQPGYDTHTHQLETHRHQLQAFDRALALLVAQLKAQGRWSQTLLLVHSEFGRRVAENGSGGTDHGTAGPAFFIGGAVQGGSVGRRADLARLDDHGNLVAGIDFRRLYATVAGRWFALPVNRFEAQGHAVLEGVLA